MANEIISRDQNRITVLAGITDDSNQEIRMLRVDSSTNRLLVSATGGSGGLTEITVTGTVNGSNTVFTTLTEPTFIVSDGVWNKASDRQAVPQTNWTWVAGTLTMTVPPQSDIYGF